MDIVIEVLLEIYVELMMLIVPEKNVSKKHKLIAKIIAVLVVIGIFVLVIWGASLIIDHNNLWGIAPISAGVIISLIQVIAGIILYKNHG
ncbi:MAG: hypothetical protein II234_00985 [Clostridia bacterium]|nr:hypothetical protein [Clostridia bacterium]